MRPPRALALWCVLCWTLLAWHAGGVPVLPVLSATGSNGDYPGYSYAAATDGVLSTEWATGSSNAARYWYSADSAALLYFSFTGATTLTELSFIMRGGPYDWFSNINITSGSNVT